MMINGSATSSLLRHLRRGKASLCEVGSMNKFKVGLTLAAGAVVALLTSPQAWAGPCTISGSGPTVGCTADGLTFLGTATPSNQGNARVSSIESFLSGLGFTSETYLGRAGGSSPVSVTGANSTSGTWMFNPGTTGDVAAFIAIHAGNGSTDEVWEINTPANSGSWGTFESVTLSNFDLFGIPVSAPEPASLALFGGALVGLGVIRCRRKAKASLGLLEAALT